MSAGSKFFYWGLLVRLKGEWYKLLQSRNWLFSWTECRWIGWKIVWSFLLFFFVIMRFARSIQFELYFMSLLAGELLIILFQSISFVSLSQLNNYNVITIIIFILLRNRPPKLKRINNFIRVRHFILRQLIVRDELR